MMGGELDWRAQADVLDPAVDFLADWRDKPAEAVGQSSTNQATLVSAVAASLR